MDFSSESTQPLPENAITFVHGNNSQGIPEAVVLAVHHDSFFKALQRRKKKT